MVLLLADNDNGNDKYQIMVMTSTRGVKIGKINTSSLRPILTVN